MAGGVAYLLKSCICNYYHGVILFFKLKDQICNTQNKRSIEIANRIFETCKNYVIPQGKHMFKTSSDMDMASMCEYP